MLLCNYTQFFHSPIPIFINVLWNKGAQDAPRHTFGLVDQWVFSVKISNKEFTGEQYECINKSNRGSPVSRSPHPLHKLPVEPSG